MAKNVPLTIPKEFAEKEFKLSSEAITDWNNFIRESVSLELQACPAMGGPGQDVQIDETLFRDCRKYNRGRMMTGNNILPRHSNNYGGIEDHGPWAFGLIWIETGETWLFKVDRRNAETLGPIIAVNVLPCATMISDEWWAYSCILHLEGGQGRWLNLNWLTVNHSENFIDPVTGANTQTIEQVWQKAKRRLVRNGGGTSWALLELHLMWLW